MENDKAHDGQVEHENSLDREGGAITVDVNITACIRVVFFWDHNALLHEGVGLAARE